MTQTNYINFITRKELIAKINSALHIYKEVPKGDLMRIDLGYKMALEDILKIITTKHDKTPSST